MSFSEEQTKLDLFGLTLGGNAKARWLSELEKAKAALLEASDPEGSIHLDDIINAFIALYCDEEARDDRFDECTRFLDEPGKLQFYCRSHARYSSYPHGGGVKESFLSGHASSMAGV